MKNAFRKLCRFLREKEKPAETHGELKNWKMKILKFPIFNLNCKGGSHYGRKSQIKDRRISEAGCEEFSTPLQPLRKQG